MDWAKSTRLGLRLSRAAQASRRPVSLVLIQSSNKLYLQNLVTFRICFKFLSIPIQYLFVFSPPPHAPPRLFLLHIDFYPQLRLLASLLLTASATTIFFNFVFAAPTFSVYVSYVCTNLCKPTYLLLNRPQLFYSVFSIFPLLKGILLQCPLCLRSNLFLQSWL